MLLIILQLYYKNVFEYIQSISKRFKEHYDNDEIIETYSKDIQQFKGKSYADYKELSKNPESKPKTLLMKMNSIINSVDSAICIKNIFIEEKKMKILKFKFL